MNLFNHIADHTILNPIRDFSSYFFLISHISIIDENIFQHEHVIFVVLKPEFIKFDFEKEFLKQFKTVYCSIDPNFLNYDIKMLKLYLSDTPCSDLEYKATKHFLKSFYRVDQKLLLEDLQYISEYLRTSNLLENF